MKSHRRCHLGRSGPRWAAAAVVGFALTTAPAHGQQTRPAQQAQQAQPAEVAQQADAAAARQTILMGGDGPGWVTLGEADFTRVNGDDKTLVWEGGTAIGSGTPIGVTRSVRPYKNFELLIQWRHEKPAGNSGVFLWVPMSAMEGLPPDKLPDCGIEIQMLDHDFKRRYEQQTGKPGDWFSTNGDVFPVVKAKMKPFPPLSPDGSRSFPTKNLSRGAGLWNHYYVRAINGEVRLWVNGEEVSGGRDCQPSEGYLCLESEGSPITFRDIRIRELP